MHELSIVQSIVEGAEESARGVNATRVLKVHLRLGVLSGAVRDSLLFCYSFSTQGTLLEGSTLEIEEMPVVIFCAKCQELRELPDVQKFKCPVCGTPSGDLRQGREMEVRSLEVDVPDGATI